PSVRKVNAMRVFSASAGFVDRSFAAQEKPAVKKNAVKRPAVKRMEKMPVKKYLPDKKTPENRAPLNAKPPAGGTESVAADAGASAYGSPSGESKTEVFGSLSGAENKGSSLAGSPSGDTDPSIELKSIEIFKAIVGDKIRANIKYPQSCRRLGIEGSVRVRFEISSSGSVGGVEILSSSNNEDIDASAVEAVKNSVPFLPYPRDTSKSFITFVLPLNYRLN
ncbi:MAG TPA: energy transducer TonB, partial [Candidatus Wallbacteria bacterium]|nr:energy transducer TonB [Candidatus Wallbacteria bacterium]